MSIVRTVKNCVGQVLSHPYTKPIIVVVALSALALFALYVAKNPKKVTNFIIDFFEQPQRHTMGVMIFSGILIALVLGTLYLAKKRFCS